MDVLDETDRQARRQQAVIVFERECRFWGATDRQIRKCDNDPGELHQLRTKLRQQMMR